MHLALSIFALRFSGCLGTYHHADRRQQMQSNTTTHRFVQIADCSHDPSHVFLHIIYARVLHSLLIPHMFLTTSSASGT